MALTYSNEMQKGAVAPDFSLPGVDGKTHSLSDFSDRKALVVIFMCNHCPYVKAIVERVNDLAKEFQSRGVGLVAISSNDVDAYPDDSPEKMKEWSDELGFVFPYLYDESQEVAKSYGAVCTPDPFVFKNVEGQFQMAYHGRIDDNWKEPNQVKQRDLANALEAILSGQPVSDDQQPAMGCSLKWKS
jgi:peroxiredoxin